MTDTWSAPRSPVVRTETEVVWGASDRSLGHVLVSYRGTKARTLCHYSLSYIGDVRTLLPGDPIDKVTCPRCWDQLASKSTNKPHRLDFTYTWQATSPRPIRKPPWQGSALVYEGVVTKQGLVPRRPSDSTGLPLRQYCGHRHLSVAAARKCSEKLARRLQKEISGNL